MGQEMIPRELQKTRDNAGQRFVKEGVSRERANCVCVLVLYVFLATKPNYSKYILTMSSFLVSHKRENTMF
jgi:hypothetical protein